MKIRTMRLATTCALAPLGSAAFAQDTEETGASRDIVEHRECHQGLDGSFRPRRDPRQESGPALLKSMRAIEGRLCGTESHNLCARSGSI